MIRRRKHSFMIRAGVALSLLAAAIVGDMAVWADEKGPASVGGAEETGATACIDTDTIKAYTIESDSRVRFFLSDGRAVLMTLDPVCPQLKFHGYLTYTPLDGKLCVGPGEIVTRAGQSCHIAAFGMIRGKTP